MNFDDAIDMVAEFHHAFRPSTDIRLWVGLVAEETNEVYDAMRNNDKLNALKELADVAYVVAGVMLVTPEDERALSDAEWQELILIMQDAETAVFACLHHFGFTPDQTVEAVKRVHASNMTKLGEDGKPIRREDGKIMKGPNYREPDLTDLVDAG